MLNPRLDDLMTYPFERLARLLLGIEPPKIMAPISMSLGEPQLAPPAFVATDMAAAAPDWGRYPPNRGTPGFRGAVADWLKARYGLPDGFIQGDTNVLPCAGTREAIFMFALAVVPPAKIRDGKALRPAVLMPNPLYHVYSGGAVLAGAEPIYLPARAENRFLPDFRGLRADLLDRVALAYLCSPANPQGSAATMEDLCSAIEMAIVHDFVLAVDECYSEIYDRQPPVGALEAAASFGSRRELAREHIVVFNSLSKRSSAPGLRSGFVAGGEKAIAAFAKLRNFASCQTPLPIVTVAEHLWRDEDHVRATREAYRARFNLAEQMLEGRYGFYRPDGGFFLWLDVGDGEEAAKRLWAEAGLRVLPGAYLCPDEPELQAPGTRYIRLALVHDLETIGEALTRLRRVLN